MDYKVGKGHVYTHPQVGVDYFLEPSVAQPPLPLHEFLPLQPLSLELQPPLPLPPGRARGLRADPADVGRAPDLPVFATVAARATVPPSKPVKAAVSTR